LGGGNVRAWTLIAAFVLWGVVALAGFMGNNSALLATRETAQESPLAGDPPERPYYTNCILHFHFHPDYQADWDAGVATDHSGNGNDGWDYDASSWPTQEAERVHMGSHNDSTYGVDHDHRWVEVPTNLVENDEYTVVIRCQFEDTIPPSDTGYTYALLGWDDYNTNPFFTHIGTVANTSGNVSQDIYSGKNGSYFVYLTTLPTFTCEDQTTNVWTVVVDQGAQSKWLDYTKVQSATRNVSPNITTPYGQIGACFSAGSRYRSFKGWYYEAIMFDRALTDTEVTNLVATIEANP